MQQYRKVTDVLLEWRRQITATQAAAQHEDMPPVSETLRRVFLSDSKSTAFIAQNSGDNVFRPLESVYPTLRRRSAKALGLPVTCPQVIFDPSTPKQWVGLMEDYCQGSIQVPKKTGTLAKEIEQLRYEFLVDDTHKPLSLEAAIALWKAEQGYWTAVGADINYFYLEPVQSLVLALPSDEISFTPLGRMPLQSPGAQLMFRIQYSEPYWVQHDYFFCDLGLE